MYFDVKSFEQSPKHRYLKLEPKASEKLLEGGDFSKEKKDKRDFALWKKVDKSQPHWDSP